MSPGAVQSLMCLALGFAMAGMFASAYQFVTERPPSFSLLERGPQVTTFAAVPFLIVAAPFIIMRNTLRGRRIEGRQFQFVTLATILAGIWSLMSGTAFAMALGAIGVIPT